MGLLKIVLGTASIIILIIILIQTFKFKKEFKEAVSEDRSLTDSFVQKWDKKLSKLRVLWIIVFVFGILTIFLP